MTCSKRYHIYHQIVKYRFGHFIGRYLLPNAYIFPDGSSQKKA